MDNFCRFLCDSLILFYEVSVVKFKLLKEYVVYYIYYLIYRNLNDIYILKTKFMYRTFKKQLWISFFDK